MQGRKLSISSVQLLSHVPLFATPWTAASQASLSIANSQSLLKLMSIQLVMPSNHLILCCPLLLPSIFPIIGVFSHKSALCIRWPKYWSFVSGSVLPMNIQDWFPLGLIGLISLQSKKLLSLFQQHSSKASILWHSVFFTVQLSHPYVTTGKTIALTRQTFISKGMSLLFNMLSRLVRRRKWQPTPVFLPGKSQGRGSLVGCRLWGRTESDTTEAT